MKIIEFIGIVRNSFIGSEEVYLKGSCYGFFCILEVVFPDAVAYYNINHIVARIGDRYYDITGEVSGDGYLPFEAGCYSNKMVEEQKENRYSIYERQEDVLIRSGVISSKGKDRIIYEG